MTEFMGGGPSSKPGTWSKLDWNGGSALLRDVIVAVGLLSTFPGVVLGQPQLEGPGPVVGWVMLPDEPQTKAEGIEVTLVYGPARIPAVSVMTAGTGRFVFNPSVLGPVVWNLADMYLYVNIEGYATVLQRVQIAGNILMLNPGPYDPSDMTYREVLPLTPVESLRAEFVTAYNELAVRHYEQAMRDGLEQKLENAIEHLMDEVEAAPEFVDAYVLLGRRLQEVNRPEEAERVLRSTLDLRPNNGALLIQLGSALLDQAMALELSGATEKVWAKYAGAADELNVAIGRAPCPLCQCR